MDNEIWKVWEWLVDHSYFTDDELNLVTYINGYNMETLNDCIYARYGYRDYEQMKEEENE